MTTICIGIPIFQEEDNLRLLVNEILSIEHPDLNFLILDNGSRNPRITSYLESLNARQISFISVRENIGFGGGIKHLIANMRSDYVGWMPGNGKVRPIDLVPIVEFIQESQNLQVFKARRGKRSISARLKTFLTSVIVSIHARESLFDSGGTPTIMKSEFIPLLEKGPNDFSFEAFAMFTFRKKSIRIVRLEVPYGERVFGESHWQKGIKSELNLLKKILASKKTWLQLIK